MGVEPMSKGFADLPLPDSNPNAINAEQGIESRPVPNPSTEASRAGIGRDTHLTEPATCGKHESQEL